MANRFYVWKDRNKTEEGREPEWKELTQAEFRKLVEDDKNKPEDERHWFYRVSSVEEGDDYYFLECTKEQYFESNREAQKRYRERKKAEEDGCPLTIYSLDWNGCDPDSKTGEYYDTVPSEETSVEEQVENNITLKLLYDAINNLSDGKREFISVWLKGKRMGATDSDIMKNMGISRRTYRNRMESALKELRENIK